MRQQDTSMSGLEIPLHLPYAEYQHQLFVYPQSVNFASTSSRNITCRVEVLRRPGIMNDTGLPQGRVVQGQGQGHAGPRAVHWC